MPDITENAAKLRLTAIAQNFVRCNLQYIILTGILLLLAAAATPANAARPFVTATGQAQVQVMQPEVVATVVQCKTQSASNGGQNQTSCTDSNTTKDSTARTYSRLSANVIAVMFE